jgi:hypothetical protein
MPVTAYTRGIEAVASGAVNLGAVTVKAMLTTASYVENKATHQFRSQVTNEVTPGAGYTAGGMNVSATVSRDEANNRVDITFSAATWTVPSGQTMANMRKAVYYVSAGAAASDRLLAVSDFGATSNATNQTVTVAAAVVRHQN